ncbi:RHS repeat-associated core domain-containing protein [bacterium]|nr:RHS repeat-associated core domain-containing protein [bacterium]
MKISISLRDGSTLEVNLSNYLTLGCYDELDRLLFERRHNTSHLIHENDIITYIYIGAIYKTCKYRYIKNILGDIILIVNDNLDIIAEYKYTAYGLYSINNLSNSNTIDYEFVEYNPFTYRSYYHDHESNLYYLINRYYSPEIEMFITPDSFNYLDPSTLYGLDLYTYCGNNPIMYVDSEGNSWRSVFEDIKKWLDRIIRRLLGR